MLKRTIFITATDTNVGKSVATLALATLLKSKGHSVGVFKPVQCAGDDASFLKKSLGLKDSLKLINPCYAKEPLSPHLAFKRAHKTIDVAKIKQAYKTLRARYDIVLVEGAGGLMVPLKDNYFNADLVRELNAELIIVSRLGLGTINHTLLTINQAKAYGLDIKGVLFSDINPKQKSIAEKTNPEEIGRLSGVKILGVIPYLRTKTMKEALKACHLIDIN